MFAVFCLRLAVGLLACLLLLPAAQVHPRFYRTHLITAQALAALALWSAWDEAGTPLRVLLAAGAVLALAGAVLWSVEGAPGGRLLILVTVAVLGVALVGRESALAPEGRASAALVAGAFSSAALLGSALTAMLLGHSYLIAPAMSLTPLLRMLAALAVTLAARMIADGYGLWRWTAGHSFGSLRGDELLWLPVRWGVGLLLPLALGWMAWQSARIRSTQSATGILYVVVVFCFLGELTSQLLRASGLTL
jgi:hypothetical protein